MIVFPPAARAEFGRSYPERAHKLHHSLSSHPLLELDALARLAGRLPADSIECNLGDQPIGVDRVPDQLREGVAETIRNIGRAGCWVGLRNVEQAPEYAALLAALLEGMRPQIEAATGPMMNLQSFIFITSPGGVTPYHFDPEHNILLQVRGSKVMTVFTAGDPAFAADEIHEAYHRGGRPELPWSDDIAGRGSAFDLSAGDAVYVPVMAPHFVKNGSDVSVSISITWRSAWSYAEADARGFNGMLRRMGMKPAAPRRWPHQNRGKAYGWRMLRNLRRLAR